MNQFNEKTGRKVCLYLKDFEKFVEIGRKSREDSQYWLDSSKIFNDTQWKAKLHKEVLLKQSDGLRKF